MISPAEWIKCLERPSTYRAPNQTKMLLYKYYIFVAFISILACKILYTYCIPIQICIEFSDLIGWEAVRTGAYGLAYGLAYGPANCRSESRHQIYYFRRVIGEISSVGMWSSISSLPYSKLNMRHEEAAACLKHVTPDQKFKILFSQFKSVFRFINVWQACFQTMLKRRIFTWNIEILGLFL